jgi:hypothetical protein
MITERRIIMKTESKIIILLALFLLPFFIVKSSFGEGAGNVTPTRKADSAKDIQRILEKFQSNKVTSFIVDMTNPSRGPDQFYFLPQECNDVVDAGKPMVPYLLDLLSNKDAGVRLSAYWALCDITNKDFGNREIFFDEKNVKGTIQSNLYKKKWEDWWTLNKTKTRVQWLLDDIHEVDIDGIYKNRYLSVKDQITAVDGRFLDQLWATEPAIQKLGDYGDKTTIPELRKLLKALKYLHSNHWMVQNPIASTVDSLQKLGDRCVIPDLIDILLRNDMDVFRKQGHEQIEKLAGIKFSFDPNAAKEKREESIAKIEKWWEENKDKICK